METLVNGLNATGNFVIHALDPIPDDVIVIFFGCMVGWMWLQNFKSWLRMQREKRLARECQECEPGETLRVMSVELSKQD